MTKQPEIKPAPDYVKIWPFSAVDRICGEKAWAGGHWGDTSATMEYATLYRRADLTPKVKALVWHVQWAYVLYGSYYVEQQGDDFVSFFIPPSATRRERHWVMLGSSGTLNEGRKICADEHETRVRAQLCNLEE